MPVPVLLMAREMNLGGVERDVSKFARHLCAYGIAPHVASFSPGGMRWREVEAAGIPLLPLPVASFRSRSGLAGAWNLRRYLREHRIQVFHAFDQASAVFGVPVARVAGVPVAISSQLCYRELVPPNLRLLLPALDRIATALFVNCEAMADHLVRDCGVPRSKIRVCYNGVETDEFHPRGRVRPESLAPAGVVIGTVAVLREEKNLPLLMDAFAGVRRSADPTAMLLIVGSGPMRAGLERQALDLGVAGACVFEEATDAPARWMRAIDIFVLPSRSEAFSNALLEAMACGCCPVGSRVGGTPELIRHGERGFLFEPGNLAELTEMLSILAADPLRRRAMADAAARFSATELNIQVASARLASIYKSLLAGHAIQAP